MIEVALEAFAHHRFESPAAQGCVSAFAKIGKVGHEEHAHFIRPIINERIVDLDVDAQEIESEPFGGQKIVLYDFHRPCRVDAIRIKRLMQCTTQVTRKIVDTNSGGHTGSSGVFEIDLPH